MGQATIRRPQRAPTLMTEPTHDTPTRAAPRPAGPAVVLAAALLCTWLGAWSWGTAPTVGDEARHFRRAVNYYEAPLAAMRVARDPAYPAEGPGRIWYHDPALWHLGLALLWKGVGQPSQLVAQAYHLGFFFLLVVFTYFVGRDLAGRRSGVWAAALVATVPLNLLLATVFYLEVPMLAFLAMGLFALLRRRPVLMGAALAGAVLTKHTTATVLVVALAPAVVLYLGETWPRRLARAALAAAAFALVLLPDLLWRQDQFGAPFIFRDQQPTMYPLKVAQGLTELPPPVRSAVALSVLNPVVVGRMLGATGLAALAGVILVGPGALAAMLLRAAKARRSQGWAAGARALADDHARPFWTAAVPGLFYVLVFLLMLRGAHDIRYLQPATLFGALLAGPVLARVRRPEGGLRGVRVWHVAVAALVGVAACQVLLAPVVVRQRRVLDPEVAAGYDWIRRHTAPDARFLYLEESLTALTGRPIFWAAALPRFLFGADEADQVLVWASAGLDYIAIHPTRRTDTYSPDAEPMAFPRAWIASLEGRPYLERVRPEGDLETTNGVFLVYRIHYDRAPREWLAPLEEPQRLFRPETRGPPGGEGL